ncbi:MAG: hypothetical protein R2752_22135 [Vicinamibacterales bacterium]
MSEQLRVQQRVARRPSGQRAAARRAVCSGEFTTRSSNSTATNTRSFTRSLLTDTFREAIAHGTPGPLNFHLDEHWTPAGHAVAAEAIDAWLEHHEVFPFLTVR